MIMPNDIMQARHPLFHHKRPLISSFFDVQASA
jgi:hypothetical protein